LFQFRWSRLMLASALPFPFAPSQSVFPMPEAAAPGCLREADSGPLASLAGVGLGGRFRLWRGASGRRYMVSVYGAHDCPAYEHAVLIGAAEAVDGTRRIAFIEDTGAFPEAVVDRARARLAAFAARTELHVHLLAASPRERRAAIDDLSPPPEFVAWRSRPASHSSSAS
jgi:hypothetical protein